MTEPRPPDPAASEEAPRRLRRAEAVLARRTGRILLVLERSVDTYNHLAALRTAEAFGLQYVWIVDPVPGQRQPGNAVTKGAWRWLTVRRFATPAGCLAALRAEGREIWATDLAPGAEALDGPPAALPRRLALVVGREADGVSPETLAAADRRLRLPMYGFTGSFNLSVATGLLLQRLLDACPEARGDLDESERRAVREDWYRRLAGSEDRWAEYRRWLDRPPPPLPDVELPPEAQRPRIPRRIRQRMAEAERRWREERRDQG